MTSTRQRAHIVCGNAGAGKSTFAERLRTDIGAVLLDIDTVTERLARLVLSGQGLSVDDRDSEAYKALLREPIYETLFDVARDNLDRLPCVIVGPFTRERRQSDWPERLRARLGTEVAIYHVWCGTEERRRRLEQRANPRDRAKLLDFAAYAAQGEDASPLPFPHQYVDTSGQSGVAPLAAIAPEMTGGREHMVEGSCLCGAVAYVISTPLIDMHHCHCSRCRKQHGAAFATFARAPRSSFRLTRGVEHVREYRSSAKVIRTFCDTCGSSLQFLFDGVPDMMWIAAGTFDGVPDRRPEAHIFVGSKAPWHDITDDLPCHEEYPPRH